MKLEFDVLSDRECVIRLDGQYTIVKKVPFGAEADLNHLQENSVGREIIGETWTLAEKLMKVAEMEFPDLWAIANEDDLEAVYNTLN